MNIINHLNSKVTFTTSHPVIANDYLYTTKTFFLLIYIILGTDLPGMELWRKWRGGQESRAKEKEGKGRGGDKMEGGGEGIWGGEGGGSGDMLIVDGKE